MMKQKEIVALDQSYNFFFTLIRQMHHLAARAKNRATVTSTPLDRIKSGTPHILNHLICDQHEILPNFHVLTISVAAMDQQLFFVSSF